ncbi:MAG TPA: LamG domain-containing protein [Terriglobales bacterium]|nr:LamG domain-containing protein [Terriglobales bacterium]
MYLNGNYDYMLNLREAGAVELNGRTALTVELFYKPDQTVTAGSYNLLSSSGAATGPDGNTSFAIQHTSTDQIIACLNVNGSVQCLNSPNNSIAKGSTYHLAVTYDGAAIRLFINGVLKSSVVASGAIRQKAAEDFTIGAKVMGFMESTFDSPMTKGWVDSIRISNNARYTANFTAPTAKHGNDGNTMFLLNFDNNYDQFTVATTMYGQQHLFLRRFGGGIGQVGNFHLSDMAFIGTGPEFIYVIASLIDNVEITAARRGLQFVNNCYLNRLTSVRVVAQSTAQFALGFGAASGVLTMNDIAISGAHYPFYLDSSSAVIHGLWVEMAEGTEIGAVFKGTSNSTAVVDHPVFSTETNPSTIKYSVATVGFGALTMTGGVLETSASAPHVGVFGGGTIVHVAGNYSAAGTPPASVFQIVTPPTNPVQLIAPMQQWISIPYADNMAYMQATQVKVNQSCAGTDKASGITSTGTLTCTPTPAAYTLTLMNTGANAPANSTTYYFGGDIIDYNNSNFDAAKIEVPKAGTLKRVQIRESAPSGNVASAENVTHKVCVNTGTNCFGGTTFAYNSTSTSGTDITLNQAVAAGDTVAIRVDTPAWATKPTNVRWYAVLYIE